MKLVEVLSNTSFAKFTYKIARLFKACRASYFIYSRFFGASYFTVLLSGCCLPSIFLYCVASCSC